MNGLKRLIVEIHRRSLWQVLGVYLFGSWVAYEVILSLMEGLGLPGWVPPLALVLFVIGLPIVLATAVVQEGMPTRRSGPEAAEAERLSGLETATDAVAATGQAEAVVSSAADAAGEAAASTSSPVLGFFTWRKAIAGGVLAFAALGLATTGFMGMRTLGIGPMGTLLAKGALEERGRIVLAQFANRTSDANLGAAVTEALRIDLHASPVIELLDPTQAAQVLALMQRDASEPVGRATALEIAVREGLEAIVAGEVTTLGASYVLTAEIVAADGAVLASFRETARDAGEIIDAVDRLSERMRGKVGESLSDVRASPPLQRVTTTSLDALRAFAEGQQQMVRGEYLEAVDRFEEAIQADTTFAMAYRKLGISLGNVGVQPTRRLAALARAYELRDRLSERERLRAEGSYLSSIGEGDAAIAAYERLLERYPDDNVALVNLPNAYRVRGMWAEAEELLRRNVANGTAIPLAWYHLANVVAAQGRREEALMLLDTAEILYPDNLILQVARWHVAMVDADFTAADSLARAMDAGRSRGTIARAQSLIRRIYRARTRGRIREGIALARELADEAAEGGLGPEVITSLDWVADMQLTLLGDTAGALRTLADALDRQPLDEMPARDRPYYALAWTHAAAGQPEQAEAYHHQWQEVRDETTDDDANPALRALIAASRGDFRTAIETIDVDERTACRICRLPELGDYLLRAGMADSAIVVYEEYLASTQLYRADDDATHLAPILERLGPLYEERGETEKAARAYARFVNLWQDADPELQPRVRYARERLQALAREGASPM